MIKLINNYDLIITNRFKYKSALKLALDEKIPNFGKIHLVNILLNINYDTSGGFRCYNLKKLSSQIY